MDRFHLSFWTDDLERAQRFYESIGCVVGRVEKGWIDLDFFGHQVTLHQARWSQGALPGVGPSKRTLDHFGVILDRGRWDALLGRLEALDAEFRVRPTHDASGRSGKFVVIDPDGLGLEFKYDGRGGSTAG